MERSIAVRMQHISKAFPNVRALDDVSVDFMRGEIHAIVGENGAGKSTLMKILYGEYAPDAGAIIIGDTEHPRLSTKEAIHNSIGMVHQEFMLIQDFSVLENIVLGFEPGKSFNRIDFDEAKKRVQPFIMDYGMHVELNKKVKNISVGEAQRVEIIKALYRGAQTLILDEPTAVLTPQETEKLFLILRKMAADGKTIIFISHKLKEVISISDRITVMRAGRRIDTRNTGDVTVSQLANMMVGREVFMNVQRAVPEFGEVVLRVEDLNVKAGREISSLKDISFTVRRGEVLGIAGVDGNGQTELVEALTGLRRIAGGKVSVLGRDITNLSPKRIRQSQVAHIPEDRNRTGLSRLMTIEENLIATKVSDKAYSMSGVLRKRSILAACRDIVAKYDIRPDNPRMPTENLSGGNAQKVVVAREVEMHTSLLIAAQPTRGVDIGSIESIRSILNSIKREGVAILLISADLDELLSLSDTIAVLYEGRITGYMENTEEATEQNLGILMMGGKIA